MSGCLMRSTGLASAAMSSLKKVWNHRQLSAGTKVHVYNAIIMSILLYASETWTLLAANNRRLEAFDMRALPATWRDHITNEAILTTTGLTPLQDILSKWRESLFGRHQVLRIQMDLSTGQKPNVRWRQTPGRPRKPWCCKIWPDVGMSPRNYWDACIYHGVMQRSTRASQCRWWWW